MSQVAKIDLLVGHGQHAHCDVAAIFWQEWADRAFARCDPALIDLSLDYHRLIDRKSRQMIAKSIRRGYEFGAYAYNEHLDEMHAIDVSKRERQGRPMSEGYRRPHSPLLGEQEHCTSHQTLYLGAKMNGSLRAYSYLVVCGEAAILNRIIGHADSLADGVMNGLVAHIVEVARQRGARWLNYLTMESATDGLTAFKESVGFRSTRAVFLL